MKKISTGFSGANIKKFSGHFQKRLTDRKAEENKKD